MQSQTVIDWAPLVTGAGAGLLLLSFYCLAPWSEVLSTLALVLCSASLGALVVAFPQSDA